MVFISLLILKQVNHIQQVTIPRSTYIKSKGPTFKSSIIYQDAGFFRLKNVCLHRKPGKQRLFLEIFTNTWGQGQIKDLLEDKRIQTWTKFLVQEEETHPRKDLVLEPTLYLLHFDNPAHCFFDETLNIANVSNTLYVLSLMGSDWNSRQVQHHCGFVNIEQSWCCGLWRNLGFIKKDNHVTLPACFTDLIFPKHMNFRYGLATPKHVQHDPMPYANIRWIQKSIQKLVTSKPPIGHIVVYDRKDSQRRIWANAPEFVKVIREELQQDVLHTSIMGTMRLEQQSRLFYDADIIVMPHGAALSNLIFARPSTTIFELYCKQGLPQISNTHWNGPETWFSGFSNRYGNQHFVYVATCSHFHSKTFHVNVTHLVEIIKTRVL